MEPEHTLFVFDCRPMKAAARHALSEFEAGRADREETTARLRALAASLPDLDPTEYARYMEKLLVRGNVDRARKLVDCLRDGTLRAWVRPTAKAIWALVKGSAALAVVAVVVWVMTR